MTLCDTFSDNWLNTQTVTLMKNTKHNRIFQGSIVTNLSLRNNLILSQHKFRFEKHLNIVQLSDKNIYSFLHSKFIDFVHVCRLGYFTNFQFSLIVAVLTS